MAVAHGWLMLIHGSYGCMMQLYNITDARSLTCCHMRAARQVGVMEGVCCLTGGAAGQVWVLQGVFCLTGGAARGGGKVSESCTNDHTHISV